MKQLIILATLLALGAPASAVSAYAQETGLPVQEEPRPFLGAPLGTLEELAATLGEAHAIRSLCNGDSDQTWRNYMFELLALEAPGGPRRSALTGAFNRGYRSQAGAQRECTPDMVALEAGIAARGRDLADAAASSYLH